MTADRDRRAKTIAGYAIQYGTWLLSLAIATFIAVMLRSVILSVMVRITEAGYWGGVRVTLVDRVYIVTAGIALTVYLVAGEYYLRRGRETGRLARRVERVFGIQALVLGLVLLAFVLLNDSPSILTIAAPAPLVIGGGVLLRRSAKR